MPARSPIEAYNRPRRRASRPNGLPAPRWRPAESPQQLRGSSHERADHPPLIAVCLKPNMRSPIAYLALSSSVLFCIQRRCRPSDSTRWPTKPAPPSDETGPSSHAQNANGGSRRSVWFGIRATWTSEADEVCSASSENQVTHVSIAQGDIPQSTVCSCESRRGRRRTSKNKFGRLQDQRLRPQSPPRTR